MRFSSRMSFEFRNIRSIVLLLFTICYLFFATGGDTRQIGKRNGTFKFYNSNEIELLRRSKAADIKSWLETNEDPCNDFYNYVCGNWPRIYGDEVSKYTELNRAMDTKISKFIGNLRAGDEIEGKIRNFYQSCLNVKADGCEYIEALKILYEQFGKFSFLKKKGVAKSKTNFNWWSNAAEIYNLYGYGFIINIKVDYDHRNDDNETLMIYLEEPTTKYRSTTDKAQMEDYLRKYFGASEADAQQVVNEVLTFEKSLSEATSKTDKDDSHESQYSLYNLTTVHRQYRDLFDVESFLKTALNLAEMPLQIYVKESGYFDKLLNILQNTKTDTVEDYLLWAITAKYLIDVDTKDMKHLCARITNFYFFKYLQHTIYQEFRSNEFEYQIYILWQDIKTVFREDLQNGKYQWISTATREQMIEKLNNINYIINTYHQDNFEDFFKGLQIDSLNYVTNIQNIHKHMQEARRDNKLQTNSKSIENWEYYSFSAFYEPKQNMIRIPVSYLLPFHLWHPAYPKAILYANIGTTLAHQMMHAFDDIATWWDESSNNAFEERCLCFRSQYHNYTKGKDSHHIADLSEEFKYIADNSALKIAYSAYMRWINNDTGKEPNHNGETFPSMTYNNQELFFISYGQRWCEGTTDVDDIEKRGHNQLRVIGALSNFAKFSEVFKCAGDAAMNPVKKCEIF